MGSVHLGNTPAGSSSSAEINRAGDLVIEFYDFGSEAQACWGNDVAFLLTVKAVDKRPLLERLLGRPLSKWESLCLDAHLLKALEVRFENYFQVRDWLTENGVPFEKSFDSWA